MLVKNRAICSIFARSFGTTGPRRSHYADWACLDSKRHQFVDQVIRVDHAGEAGALSIYEGQLAVLRRLPGWWAPGVHRSDPAVHEGMSPIAMVEHMRDQEKEHLHKFEQLMQEHQTRPSLLSPLWHASGYLAGAVSAVCGEKTAMALTIAVEEVIQEHYNDQIREMHDLGMKDSHADLRQTLVKFRDEEAEHCQTGKNYRGLEAPLYKQLSKVVKASCGLVIKVAERI